MYADSKENPEEEQPSYITRVNRFLIGPPRDLEDRHLFHRLSLIAFLAWVGLGADGLSSSCYGPEEAFRTLGRHTYLAIPLAIVMMFTVFIIAYAYSRVIEHFPHGGGGYVVTSKLLGSSAGVVSGSALLVDYVLTITVSIAAAGDALFSFLPAELHGFKLSVEMFLIVMMIVLNMRGVKESILIMMPIFIVFLLTHVVLIVGGFLVKLPNLPVMLQSSGEGFSSGHVTLGMGGLLLLFLHAYSLGGGTYTGIEAVSNGLSIMREPHVVTGKRTMLYMAASLAFTASGLLFCYLLWEVTAVQGKTLNAVLAEKVFTVIPLGKPFVILALVSEGALLVVAAQAGFVDGPRVLANMAIDSWVPRRFSALSDRLTTRNGILLMGGSALAALVYTKGDVRHIVVMYSINVFLTFSMTEISMCRFWIRERRQRPDWWRKISIHIIGGTMCITILVVTVFEKFLEGGWITLLVTGVLVFACFLIRRHYKILGAKLASLYANLVNMTPLPSISPADVDPDEPTAVVLVGGYSGLGIHTFLNAFRAFPGQFKNVVFVSVGVIDSGAFKGQESLDDLRKETQKSLQKYVALAQGQGLAADYRMTMGTDAVAKLEQLCLDLTREFSHVTFFAGQLIFQRERWYQRMLHNETAFVLQKRLQFADQTLVILPARIK